jgi:hypothetical protein
VTFTENASTAASTRGSGLNGATVIPVATFHISGPLIYAREETHNLFEEFHAPVQQENDGDQGQHQSGQYAEDVEASITREDPTIARSQPQFPTQHR